MDLKIRHIDVQILRAGGKLEVSAWKDEGYTLICQDFIVWLEKISQDNP